jgi:hypothetical protein
MVDCSALFSIADEAFRGSNLQALVIRNTSSVVNLIRANAFEETPISSGDGYIYVPRDMLDAYVSATNWSVYGEQFRVLEDYTVDGTITGELDVEFGNDEMEFIVSKLDFENECPSEVFGVVIANPEMPWGEFVFGGNNDGMWSCDDNGYVMYDGQYYVYRPDDAILTAGMLVDVNYPFAEGTYDGYILLITAEEAQQFM